MRFAFGVVAGVASVLGGCATSGPTGSATLGAAPKSDTARLVIYRTSPLGFAVQPSYLVNGKPVGNSQPNGFVVCHLKPGSHQIAVANPAFNVNFGGGTDKASVSLKGGTTTYIAAEPQLGLTVGVITLYPVSEGKGKSDTAALHKIEGNC